MGVQEKKRMRLETMSLTVESKSLAAYVGPAGHANPRDVAFALESSCIPAASADPLARRGFS